MLALDGALAHRGTDVEALTGYALERMRAGIAQPS
jgi:hypothetical protein